MSERRQSDRWADPQVAVDVGDVIMGNVSILGAVPLKGNVTLDDGSLTGIVGNVTLSDPKGFIGLVTVGNTVATTITGNVTIDSGVITTITNPVALKGNLTIDSGNISLKGNVTLSDPKTFIGLVTIGGQFGYSYKQFIASSTVLVKTGAGLLHAFNVGMPSCPTTIFYDNAVPSGTKIYTIAQNYPVGSYVMDIAFGTGLSLDAVASGGGAIVPEITVSYI